MSSILTNMAAMTALQNLAATQRSLATTQNEISSGLRVANASDNAAYWSIATTMRGDTAALSSVSDALNLGSSVVGTATAAVNSTLSIMYKIKADLVTAETPGTDKAQVQSDISAQQQSLLNIISSASFNGVNLLDGSQTTNNPNGTNVIASFSRSTNGTTSVGTINIVTQSTPAISTLTTQLGTSAAGGTQLTGSAGILAISTASLVNNGVAISASSTAANDSTAYDPTVAANAQAATAGTAAQGASAAYVKDSILGFKLTDSSTSADLSTLSNAVDAAITAITSTGAALGAVQTNITNQSTFVTALSDSITSGVGSLVDADMNDASTRLNALQTQQQLGVQSLSIANQNSQLILKLFQ